MSTFLTTRRMAPALAARVEASVRGKRSAAGDPPGARWSPSRVTMARLGVIAAVVALFGSVVVLRRNDRRDFEAARAVLLDAARAASASLTPEDEGAVARMESWLTRSAGAYEGDFVSDEVKAKGALAAVLTRPTVYVRGTVAQMASSAGIAQAAAASLKDPFLVCLVEPPASRAEGALLAKVRDAYSSSAEQHSPHVRRLREAQVGLPFLLRSWSDKIRGARSSEELDELRRDFEKAPIDGAKQAIKAGLLVFAMDEAGDADGPTELDGERSHLIRVGIVDLAASKVLLRMRRRVDPSWISAAKRPLYASGLDGCALAFDVRESVGR